MRTNFRLAFFALASLSLAAIALPARADAPDAAAPVKETRRQHLAPNTLYAEGFGAGLLYSLNYERIVARDQLGLRVGVETLSFSSSSSDVSARARIVIVPLTASYLGIRSGSHVLELGGGASVMYATASAQGFGTTASASGVTPLGVAMAGYRYHPLDDGGFNFRVGAMALVGRGLGSSDGQSDRIGVAPWFYLSAGASF